MDELIAGRRGDARLPADMPRWTARTIVAIDTFSHWVGRVVAWATVPLMAAMLYEITARYLFTAPTMWAYDISRMIYGAMFVIGAGYALSKGVHIRSDFLYRNWKVTTQARVDATLYIVFYFPSMLIFLWVATQWAWGSLSQGERGTDTAFMPLLGPIKSCLPVGVAFLVIQGVSELLKALYAARKGVWPQQ
ncbi:MAG TPA: TRAP transporter small permease subunit [Burkholderiales bacterium]|nr:TRAP transporter small permease subunit [Burkholderiales bacterium]